MMNNSRLGNVSVCCWPLMPGLDSEAEPILKTWVRYDTIWIDVTRVQHSQVLFKGAVVVQAIRRRRCVDVAPELYVSAQGAGH